MRTATYLLLLLATLLVAPAAHAYDYLSEYSAGGNRYYNPHGGGYERSGLTSGAGSIDRSGARRPVVYVVPVATQAPCGIYNRAPVNPCRMQTMAYNPNATVSRTRAKFNVPFISELPPYFGPRRGYGSYFSTVEVGSREN